MDRYVGRNMGRPKMRGSAALHGKDVKATAKQDRRLSFPDRVLLPFAVTDRVT